MPHGAHAAPSDPSILGTGFRLEDEHGFGRPAAHPLPVEQMPNERTIACQQLLFAAEQRGILRRELQARVFAIATERNTNAAATSISNCATRADLKCVCVRAPWWLSSQVCHTLGTAGMSVEKSACWADGIRLRFGIYQGTLKRTTGGSFVNDEHYGRAKLL